MNNFNRNLITVLIALVSSVVSTTAFAHDVPDLSVRFQNIDTNQDEVISLDEFKNNIVANEIMMRVEMMFNRIDRNSNGELTIDELEFMRNEFIKKSKS